VSNRVFVFGDNVDTDQLAPGQFMKDGIDVLAAHCLETLRPQFAHTVKRGDVIVAGRNFGVGSSREQAAEALCYLGIRAIIAASFAGIFYRNAINLGLPVIVASTANDLATINDGESVCLDIEHAMLTLVAQQRDIALQPLPDNIRQLLADGGLVAHLKKRFAAARQEITP